MSIYVKIGKKILKNPNIIRPHVKTKDISELNFKKMKEMGMEKIAFDKGNTLCHHGDHLFINTDIKDAFKECLEVFGTDNVMLITNLLESEYLAENELYSKYL